MDKAFIKRHKKGLTGFFFLLMLLVVALYQPAVEPIKYVDRATDEIKTEQVAGEGWLAWLYYNPVGELAMEALIKRPFLSRVYGRMMDSPSSVKKIAPFVKKYGIDLSESEKQHFDSFNDFFTRKLKPGARKIDRGPAVLVSPADGKVLAYDNVSQQDFFVKGVRFDLNSFLNDEKLAKKYRDGSLMVFRLCPVDYHRFHFPVDGKLSDPVKIGGDYYSVSPIALRRRVEVFWQNKREFVMISTQYFGDVLMAEVGATLVGGIIQTYTGNRAQKGAEKGYFKFGGSTVVLLFEKDMIKIDDDLLYNTQQGLETSIWVGERVGVSVEYLKRKMLAEKIKEHMEKAR